MHPNSVRSSLQEAQVPWHSKEWKGAYGPVIIIGLRLDWKLEAYTSRVGVMKKEVIYIGILKSTIEYSVWVR